MTTTHYQSVYALEKACGCLDAIAQPIGNRHLCPCCSNILLRHVQANQVYWRCSHCHQAMPLLGESATFMA